jgi:phosphomannomutase
MSNPPLDCVVSISGIRGIVGQTIDPGRILALAAAYGRSIAGGGLVVLGRDSRPTGELFAQAVAAGLRGVGCDVVDLGIVPTPTVPLMIARLGAAGGVQVSASHNPVAWNALKLYTADGRNIDQRRLDILLAAYNAGAEGHWRPWDDVGRHLRRDDAPHLHVQAVLEAVDTERIAAAAPKVLLDSVNGAGAVVGPMLLDRLGCRVTPLYANPDRIFPRDPEPTAANVRETGAIVSAIGADIGFVQDPDADRLAVIDEHGRYIGEEYTLVLCAAARLAAHGPGGVVATNLSTSRMVEDIAAAHGGRVVRTPVGEANVLDALQGEGAVLAGEGNGGVIDPRVVLCRDSQVAMALILELLARSGKTVSQLVAGIPSYHMHKRKVTADRAAVAAATPRLLADDLARDATIDQRDGIKLSWPDAWVHLRASGTEPATRIISEAPTAQRAGALADCVAAILGAPEATAH